MKKLLPFVAAILSILPLAAKDYYVTQAGDDGKDGQSREAAFRTINRGFDALQPGDRLTIGPGEYRETIRRSGLGSDAVDTVIRAEIPGTVVLRGDEPVEGFQPVEGSRFVYVTDFPGDREVQALCETDTFKPLSGQPDRQKLEYLPGTFYQDRTAGKLYLSTSDMHPAERHSYTALMVSAHGIYLSGPRRVTLEGLVARGFSSLRAIDKTDDSGFANWGIYLHNPKDCVVRDCRTFFNAGGIGLWNRRNVEGGGNLVERCESYANSSPAGTWDNGGISLFFARNDVVQDSKAWLNTGYGINMYGSGDEATKEAKGNVFQRNLAWGNWCDYKVKTAAFGEKHRVEYCTGADYWSVHLSASHNTIGREAYEIAEGKDNLFLGPEVDRASQFADPFHHDYRLQATSKYRGAGTDGADLGAHPYEKNVFYVGPDGSDEADGLSVTGAWKTLARAVSGLKAGDTLYLLPGVYEGGLEATLKGKADEPIVLRGRSGDAPVVLRGGVTLSDSSSVELERLTLEGGVTLKGGSAIRLASCQIAGPENALTAERVAGLRVEHCEFTGFSAAGLALSDSGEVFLSGNIFANKQGVGVRQTGGSVLYAAFNAYARPEAGWETDGKLAALGDEQAIRPVMYEGTSGLALGAGLIPQGGAELRLVEAPALHSTSETTANFTWITSLPASCEIAWGETEDCPQSAVVPVNRFGSYSLTGLKPGQKYLFRLKALSTPEALFQDNGRQTVAVDTPPLAITTKATNDAPQTYYVATDGDDTRSGTDRASAWRTIKHAASRVNVGDTVLIAGGEYSERIPVLATGAPGLPISFRAMPGEKVEIHGSKMQLNQAFVLIGKSDIQFDGLHFRDFAFFPSQAWDILNSGEFVLMDCQDITITRCFFDGRAGYTARAINGINVSDLTIQNSVVLNKMSGALFLKSCPGLVIQNSVFVRPLTNSMVVANRNGQSVTMTNNIFTDQLKVKAQHNNELFVISPINQFVQDNNCYLLRAFPVDKRNILDGRTLPELDRWIKNPLLADPVFRGVTKLPGWQQSDFSPDLLMKPVVPVDFDSFFPTNPEVIERKMGLQPEAFADYYKPQETSTQD